MDFEVDIQTVIDIVEDLDERCGDDCDLDKLNEYERTIYVTQTVEAEVNNGGFMQFFDNSHGKLAGEIVQAFNRIGAGKTAAICRRALKAVGELPTDWEERRARLNEIGDDVSEALEACDDAFYEYQDDLEVLNAAYVKKHIKHFNLMIEDL